MIELRLKAWPTHFISLCCPYHHMFVFYFCHSFLDFRTMDLCCSPFNSSIQMTNVYWHSFYAILIDSFGHYQRQNMTKWKHYIIFYSIETKHVLYPFEWHAISITCELWTMRNDKRRTFNISPAWTTKIISFLVFLTIFFFFFYHADIFFLSFGTLFK